MATIINASNGSTSGLIQTGDASGILQLQTNNGTPALTLNTAQALGVGSSPAYGTAGQVLTSGGSGAAPSWTSPSAGAMTLISKQNASGSSLEWTGLSGYNSYLFILSAFGASSSWDFQLGTGSTTWRTSSYYYGYNVSGNGYGSVSTGGGSGGSGFFGSLGGTNLLSSMSSGYVVISGNSNTPATQANMFGNTGDGGGILQLTGSTGTYFSSVTALRITTGGSFNKGYVCLYGIS